MCLSCATFLLYVLCFVERRMQCKILCQYSLVDFIFYFFPLTNTEYINCKSSFSNQQHPPFRLTIRSPDCICCLYESRVASASRCCACIIVNRCRSFFCCVFELRGIDRLATMLCLSIALCFTYNECTTTDDAVLIPKNINFIKPPTILWHIISLSPFFSLSVIPLPVLLSAIQCGKIYPYCSS